MPGVIPFFSTTQNGASTLAGQWRALHVDRLRRYAEYRAFWEGHHYDPRRRRTNLQPNYARAVVNKAVSYLFGRPVTIQTVPQPPAQPSEVQQRAQQLLDRVAQENGLDAILLQAAENASITGDAFLKVYWDHEQRRIRVQNLDPAKVFPLYRGDDPQRLRQVGLVSLLSAQEAHDRFGRGSATELAFVELVELWTESTFQVWLGNDLLAEQPNGYGFIPVIHIPNLQPANQWFGISDLEDLIPLNREYGLRLSDQSDTIHYHADPPVVFTGVEEHSNIPVAPGSVWDLPTGAEVALLEWKGQPPAVGEHLERLKKAMFEISEVPQTAFGDSGRMLSGVALETELQPVVQRTMRRRTLWQIALQRYATLVQLLAELAGVDELHPGALAPYLTHLTWPAMLPLDDDAIANRHLALTAGGLESNRTAMQQLGTADPEAELSRVVADRHQLGQTDMATPQERAGAHIRDERPVREGVGGA
jgi:SPP1 family phage portal protein